MSAPFRVGQILTASELNSLFDTPVVNVLGFAGVDNTGVKDSTTGIQTALNTAASAGQPCHAPAGTYLVTALTWPAGLSGFSGAGASLTTIKRSAANAISAANVLTATNQSGFLLSDMTIDGNKASQTTGSNGVLFDGCSDFQVSGVRAINQKTGTNYGDGIQLVNTPTTNTTGRGIVFDNCQCCDNDQSGLHVVSTGAGISVQGGVYSNNTLNGVYFDRGPAPVVNTMPDITVNAVRAERNTSGGIVLTGFLVLGLNSVYTYGHGNDPCCGATITANQANYNAGYGIFVQATGVDIVGNTARYNGTTNQAGICCTSTGATITGNNCEYNVHFGIDNGGTWKGTVSHNIVRFNNGDPSTFGVGINLGACQHIICSFNTLEDNFQQAINLPKNDNGAFYFPWDATDITIENNRIINSNSNAIGGIRIDGNPSDVFVTNNKFIWPDAVGNVCIVPQMASGTIRGNTLVGNATPSAFAIAGATTVVFPDWSDTLLITTTTSTINLVTFQQNVYSGLATSANMTNLGSGYTSAPTVTPSGSWSVAPTFTAQLTQDGRVACVLVTTRGSGITGSVTLGFSGGGGSGAAATCTLGLTPPSGKQLTIIASGSVANVQSNSGILLDLPSGTNMILQAGFSISLVVQAGIYSQIAANPTNIGVPNNTSIRLYDTTGNPCEFILQSDNHLVLYGTDGSGALRALFSSTQHSDSSGFNIQVTTGLAAGSTNFVQVTGTATGTLGANAPIVVGTGSDTDVALKLSGKGAGGALIEAFTVAGPPSTTNIPQGYAGISPDGSGGFKLYYNNAGTFKSVALT